MDYLTIDHLPAKDLTRIFSKIKTVPTASCWLWTGCIDQAGYGTVSYRGKMYKTHRFLYAWLVGAVPSYVHGQSNAEIDHLCRNRACCNPVHLELVSHRENTYRGVSFSAIYAKQDACKNGHAFTLENTRYSRKQRVCRACEREAGARKRKSASYKKWNQQYAKKPERAAYMSAWKRQKRAKLKAESES